MIWAGVSVTRTLPFGAPEDVRLRVRNAIRPDMNAMTKLPGAKDSSD